MNADDLPHVNLRDAQRTGVDHLDLPHLDGLKNVSRDVVLTKPSEMTGASVVASWVDEWNDPKIREVVTDDDGQVLAATCVDEPLTDEARAALAELARVARDRFELTPEQQRRQAAARDRIHARNLRFAAARRTRIRRMHAAYRRRRR